MSVTAPATVVDSSPIPVTATTNIDVAKAGDLVEIFDGSSGALVGYCSVGTSCTVNDQENRLGLNEFVAFVATTLPPATTLASSNVAATSRYYIP